MITREGYFKGVSIIKIVFLILFFLGGMVMVAQVEAVDNKTISRTPGGFPKILDNDKWSSQILYDTIGACYQGTIKWIILSIPSLLGQSPGPMAQREMVEHCFCVMDKIRKEIEYKEYIKKVVDINWTGNFFMLKAVECVGEYETLPTFFMKKPNDNETTTNDNETKNDTKIEVKPPDANSGKSDSLPEQPKELPEQDAPLLNF